MALSRFAVSPKTGYRASRRVLFEISHFVRFCMAYGKFNFELCRQLSNKIFIAVGLGPAESVIKMRRNDSNADLPSLLQII